MEMASNKVAIFALIAVLLVSGCAEQDSPADGSSAEQEAAASGDNSAGGNEGADGNNNGSGEFVAPSRESKLPSDIAKVIPEDDEYPTIMHSDEWEQPVPLQGGINTSGGEDSAFVMPSGKTIYFFFTPDVRVPVEKQLLDEVTGLYVSHRKDISDEWGAAERVLLQEQGKLALDGCEFVQGNEMWFCSAREGYAGVNFFVSKFADGKWGAGEYVGDKLMKDYVMGEMHITSDRQELYFHSDRNDSIGEYDIYVSRKDDSGNWGYPENVAVVNSPETDGWPFVTEDMQELWFTRTYEGTPAIFRSLRDEEGNWGRPEIIISRFAGECSLDNAGNIYFTHHFYRNGEMIEADIYVARRSFS